MFLSLPLELQLLSIEECAKRDLLMLRATCRALNRLCHQQVINQIVQEISDPTSKGSYLQNAVDHCRHDFLQCLLSLRPPVNGIDLGGEAALHRAARKGCSFCLAALLEAGADPCQKTAQDWSPLMLAARHGQVQVSQQLLSAGGGVNDRGFHGWTSLHLANKFGHGYVGIALLEAGADEHIVDNDGVKAKDSGSIAKGWGVFLRS